MTEPAAGTPAAGSQSVKEGSMSIVGVEIRRNDLSRVGEKSPARFLCTAEKNPVSEITEVTHPKADSLQNLGFVVAAFNEAV